MWASELNVGVWQIKVFSVPSDIVENNVCAKIS